MFARSVSLRLKPDTLPQFTEIFETEILPALRKQPGFQNEVTLMTAGSSNVTAISLWDTSEQSEAYNTAVYPEILKKLTAVLSGTPDVKVGTVITSTLPKAGSQAAA